MRAIICGALMALAITTAGAQQSLFSANSVLPGCKAVFEEGRGLGRQDTGYCVGAINALTFLSLMLPMWALYELGILLCRYLPKEKEAATEDLVEVR